MAGHMIKSSASEFVCSLLLKNVLPFSVKSAAALAD